jgi:hypothetical protein
LIEKDENARIKFKELSQLMIEDETEKKEVTKIPSSVLYSEKERLLVFYNMLITKISYDAAHYATLRELGIAEYQKYSSTLMTFIHEKRMGLLKSREVQPEIKKEIVNYNEFFYSAIKDSMGLSTPADDLLAVLQKFRDCLKNYADFEMLYQEVQYFLLLLLLLYNLEGGYVSTDYIFTVIEKEKNNKLNLKKLAEITKKNLDYK